MGMRDLEKPESGNAQHAYVATLEPGPVRGIYLVSDSRSLTARNGKPYLALTLMVMMAGAAMNARRS